MFVKIASLGRNFFPSVSSLNGHYDISALYIFSSSRALYNNTCKVKYVYGTPGVIFNFFCSGVITFYCLLALNHVNIFCDIIT